MQLGRARTNGLGVPLLYLARWAGWVAPVRPTLGMWFVAPCPSAALGASVCPVSSTTWRLFTGARALGVPCAVSAATWLLFIDEHAVCGMCVFLMASLGTPPPPFFFPCFSSCPRLFVPMRPTGGGYFLRTNFSPRTKIRIFERRFEFKVSICFDRNPIKYKLLGRIAAEAHQQRRAHRIDRQLSQICARWSQICARKTGFWFF